MALYFTNQFLLAFILAAIQFTSIQILGKGSLIDDICSKTSNPPLCIKALKSDPGSANADLQGLGQISIKVAQANAKSTLQMINLLAGKATDPILKGQLKSCSENYDDAVDNLDKAKNFLKSGDYGSLNIYASAVVTNADTCDDTFKESTASPEPPQLKEANKKLEDLTNIILVISNALKV